MNCKEIVYLLIERQIMNIVIIGMGYVGMVTSAFLTEQGNSIVGTDIDRKKIRMLRNGEVPFFETNLKKLMEKNKDRLKFYFILCHL